MHERAGLVWCLVADLAKVNTYLRFNFLSDLSKGASGIDVFSIDNMRNVINNNHGLSIYESVENVPL